VLHWPGDPAVLMERVRDMDKADTVNFAKIMMGAHSGTHIDAPAHFLNGARGNDAIPFATLIGPARVIDIAAPGAVTRGELEKAPDQTGGTHYFKDAKLGEETASEGGVYGPPGCTLNEASFVPPSPHEAMTVIGDLERYFRDKTKLPVLIDCARYRRSYRPTVL
jgi:hypothetical protein